MLTPSTAALQKQECNSKVLVSVSECITIMQLLAQLELLLLSVMPAGKWKQRAGRRDAAFGAEDEPHAITSEALLEHPDMLQGQGGARQEAACAVEMPGNAAQPRNVDGSYKYQEVVRKKAHREALQVSLRDCHVGQSVDGLNDVPAPGRAPAVAHGTVHVAVLPESTYANVWHQTVLRPAVYHLGPHHIHCKLVCCSSIGGDDSAGVHVCLQPTCQTLGYDL